MSSKWFNLSFVVFSDREIKDHGEVVILLEGYRTDLQEMEIELQSMCKQIEDIREIINIHQVCLKLPF